MRLLAAGILLLAHLCTAFYLPGLAPVSFCDDDKESEGCKVREPWREARRGSPMAEQAPRGLDGVSVTEEPFRHEPRPVPLGTDLCSGE